MQKIIDTDENVARAIEAWLHANGLVGFDGWARSSSYYAIIVELDDGTTRVVKCSDLGLKAA